MKRQPENKLKNEIWKFLRMNRVFAWIVYQPMLKPGQFHQYHQSSTGVADILGIYEGKPLAIEVKYGKGKTSDKQDYFLDRFRKNGGIAFVAWSLEDVIINLGMRS